MSAGAQQSERRGWQRLPGWLAPLERERPGRELRRIQTTVLVLIGLALTVATVNDLSRQINVNHRLIADLHTWRVLTGHDYHNISVQQNVTTYSSRDVLCGNVSGGPPGARNQICLIMTGTPHHGKRQALGGYYLPAYHPDLRANRFWCFGSASTERLCALASPPAGATRIPLFGQAG